MKSMLYQIYTKQLCEPLQFLQKKANFKPPTSVGIKIEYGS